MGVLLECFVTKMFYDLLFIFQTLSNELRRQAVTRPAQAAREPEQRTPIVVIDHYMSQFLPIGQWCEGTLEMVQMPEYIDYMSQRIMRMTGPLQHTAAFNTSFASNYLKEQFSYRLMAYSYWGATRR